MVSIVMPAYNSAKYIDAAIQSVLHQTFSDWELIIIDDCSNDETFNIASSYANLDKRINVLHNDNNIGVSSSRTKGVSLATGEWIAFLDSDDLWRYDKLEKQFSFAMSSDAILIYTGSSFIDELNKPLDYTMHVPARVNYANLLKGNVIPCSSVMIMRSVMQRYPMAGDYMHEDYTCWLQFLRDFPYAFGIDEPLLTYRISRTSKSSKRYRSAKMLFNSYRHIGYNPIHAFLLTLQYMSYSIKKHYLIRHGRC